MKSEDRRDNEALYNKMTLDELSTNFSEAVISTKHKVKYIMICYLWLCYQ